MHAAIIAERSGNVYWIEPDSNVLRVRLTTTIQDTPEEKGLIESRLRVLDEIIGDMMADNGGV